MTWRDGTARATGPDPYLDFALRETRFVCGIRLRFAHANAEGTTARFQLSWRRGDEPDFDPARRYTDWGIGTSEVFVLPGTSGANQRKDYDGRPNRLAWWRELAALAAPELAAR